MTRKTGKLAVKVRQQMRAARLAKYRRELAEAGVKLSLPKPSAEARRQKEEELRQLYAELFPKKAEQEAEREEQAEQPTEEQPEEKAEEQPKEEKQPAEGEQQPS